MVMKSTLNPPRLHSLAVIAVDLLFVLVEGAELSDVPCDECPGPCAVFVLGHCPWNPWQWCSLPSTLTTSHSPGSPKLSPLEMRRMQLLPFLTASLWESWAMTPWPPRCAFIPGLSFISLQTWPLEHPCALCVCDPRDGTALMSPDCGQGCPGEAWDGLRCNVKLTSCAP